MFCDSAFTSSINIMALQNFLYKQQLFKRYALAYIKIKLGLGLGSMFNHSGQKLLVVSLFKFASGNEFDFSGLKEFLYFINLSQIL